MAEEVITEILWSNIGRQTFDNIIEYLQSNFTDREITRFINQLNKLLGNMKRYPEMGRPSLKRKNVRLAILNKHTQLIYFYKPGQQEITILLFWNFKQNSSNLKY